MPPFVKISDFFQAYVFCFGFFLRLRPQLLTTVSPTMFLKNVR